VRKRLIFCLILPTLGACSTSYPLYLKVPTRNEVFIGKATSQIFGKSSFSIRSPDGVICTGNYKATVSVNPQEGTANAGIMQCSDGRTGSWVISGAGVSGGQGVGKLNGENVIIMYGGMARISSF
jgi:hypothetical protein